MASDFAYNNKNTIQENIAKEAIKKTTATNVKVETVKELTKLTFERLMKVIECRSVHINKSKYMFLWPYIFWILL